MLVLSAIALAGGAGAGSALAARPVQVAMPATDPTLGAGLLAWSVPAMPGMLAGAAAGTRAQLSGSDPALGGPNLAFHTGDLVTVTANGATVGHASIAGLQQLAVSADWLVARAIDTAGRTALLALPLPALAPQTEIATEPSGVDLGRPALDGRRLVVAINGGRNSRLVEFNLGTRRRRVLRSSHSSQLLNPSLLGDKLLYARATNCDQRLVLGSPKTAAGERILLRIGSVASRDAGHESGHTTQGSEPSRCPAPAPPRTRTTLWTTALATDGAYVTELTPRPTGPPVATLFGIALG